MEVATHRTPDQMPDDQPTVWRRIGDKVCDYLGIRRCPTNEEASRAEENRIVSHMISLHTVAPEELHESWLPQPRTNTDK